MVSVEYIYAEDLARLSTYTFISTHGRADAAKRNKLRTGICADIQPQRPIARITCKSFALLLELNFCVCIIICDTVCMYLHV